jgi:hypothetical protein
MDRGWDIDGGLRGSLLLNWMKMIERLSIGRRWSNFVGDWDDNIAWKNRVMKRFGSENVMKWDIVDEILVDSWNFANGECQEMICYDGWDGAWITDIWLEKTETKNRSDGDVLNGKSLMIWMHFVGYLKNEEYLHRERDQKIWKWLRVWDQHSQTAAFPYFVNIFTDQKVW